jgi:hypothetical protein
MPRRGASGDGSGQAVWSGQPQARLVALSRLGRPHGAAHEPPSRRAVPWHQSSSSRRVRDGRRRLRSPSHPPVTGSDTQRVRGERAEAADPQKGLAVPALSSCPAPPHAAPPRTTVCSHCPAGTGARAGPIGRDRLNLRNGEAPPERARGEASSVHCLLARKYDAGLRYRPGLLDLLGWEGGTFRDSRQYYR